jgi:hypothetical protein
MSDAKTTKERTQVPAHNPPLNIIAKTQGNGDEKRTARPMLRTANGTFFQESVSVGEKCDFIMLPP